ncbi:EF-hand domain-containing family member C2, partial [Caerostris darwini]
FPKENNKINIIELVEKLNWIENPVDLDRGQPELIQINWERNETGKDLNKIRYNCFMVDLCTSEPIPT